MDSDHEEDGDQKDVLNFATLVEEFFDLGQGLLYLTPSLMELEESRQLPEKDDESNSVIAQAEFQSELFHDHFKRIILDKHPDIQPALVERLAKKCWNLYKHRLIKQENAIKDLTQEDKDSTYGSSEWTPSLIAKLTAKETQDWDEASETSSLAEDSVHLEDRPTIPQPSVDLGPDIDFVCTICSRLQVGMSKSRAWR